MSATIHCGDVRAILPTLPANSVQCCVTSPPYYALRDYGVDGQIGLEPTIAEYLAAMVAVFRDVRRVLRDDGTLWLNIGDSYNTYPVNRGLSTGINKNNHAPLPDVAGGYGLTVKTLKPKDLMLIPARLALALQEDGWWVRSEIIWAKPNPMPESVQDRPTVAHEHIWLLTKAARYFYDADAIRTPAKSDSRPVPAGWDTGDGAHGSIHRDGRREKQRGHGRRYDGFNDRWDGMTKDEQQAMGANARTVWDIATQGYAGAHFATFPVEIPRRCILAGTSERGACPACGAPWKRTVERESTIPQRTGDWKSTGETHRNDIERKGGYYDGGTTTTGWQPTCPCDAGEPVPCVVLDPFSGAGTTGVVALRHGRGYIGVELNAEYAEMSRRRIYGDAPLLNSVELAPRPPHPADPDEANPRLIVNIERDRA